MEKVISDPSLLRKIQSYWSYRNHHLRFIENAFYKQEKKAAKGMTGNFIFSANCHRADDLGKKFKWWVSKAKPNQAQKNLMKKYLQVKYERTPGEISNAIRYHSFKMRNPYRPRRRRT